MHFQTSLLTTAVFAALAVSQQIEVIAPDDQCYLQAGTSSGDTIYGCYGVSEPFAPNNDGDCSDIYPSTLDYSLCGSTDGYDNAYFRFNGTQAIFFEFGTPDVPNVGCDLYDLVSGAHCIAAPVSGYYGGTS